MMSNAEDFVKYQYEMAELQGKTAVWSNVFDNGKVLMPVILFRSLWTYQ